MASPFFGGGSFEFLLETNIPWMLTYNDCPYIRELYSLESTNHEKIKIKEVGWKYGMNKTKKSEIVITSF